MSTVAAESAVAGFPDALPGARPRGSRNGLSADLPMTTAAQNSGFGGLTFREGMLYSDSMSKMPEKNLSELLRDALANRPGSFREIEAATGVPNPSLIRFLRGDQDLKLASAEALMRHFGIRAVAPKPGRTKKG